MKSFLIAAVAVSLVLNAFLARELFRRSDHGGGDRDAAAAGAVAAGSQQAAASATAWADLQTEELPALVERLRQGGFPPRIVRAIVAAQLREQFAARRRAIEAATAQQGFWKNTTSDMKQIMALRELSREQDRLLRELLGPDANPDEIAQIYRDRGLVGLPPAKANEVRRIIRDIDEQRQDFYMSLGLGGGVMTFTPADREKLDSFEKAQHAAIAKALTPDELELYDLMTSNTAQSLRYQLIAFNPTEQEFRALYRLRREFGERNPPITGPLGPEEMQARSKAEQQLQEQMKLALGPVRAVEFERANDYNYRQASQLVTRLGLPPETTGQLYDIQKDFQKRVGEAMRDAGSREEAVQRATALQAEALARVAPLLGGERGVEAYKQYGGRWLTTMVPRPPSAPPTSDGSSAIGRGAIRLGP